MDHKEMERISENVWVQTYSNPLIEKIVLDLEGHCTIWFRDGRIVKHCLNCEAVYQGQFGIPVSLDGRLLFLSSWETGLTAYDTVSGELLWRYKRSRICKVFPYEEFVLAHRYGMGLVKLEITTGTVLQEIKSGTVERCFYLDGKHLLLDRWRGKLTVLDGETMKAVKTYSEKAYNPDDCYSLVITSAYLQEGALVVEGFENYANRNMSLSNQHIFCRIIDPAF